MIDLGAARFESGRCPFSPMLKGPGEPAWPVPASVTLRRLLEEAWTTDRHNDALQRLIFGGLLASIALFAVGFLLRVT